MATPRQLVAEIAKQTGVHEATVILHDRNLATVGLRSEGKRGRGKSAVTYEDAANLLIAVASSRNVKDSARTAEAYGELCADQPLTFDDEGQIVERGHTFRDALASFLETVPSMKSGWHPDDHISVSLFGPYASARIEWSLQNQGSGRIEYQPALARDRNPPPFADLKFVSIFSQVTLGYVGELVAEE